MISTRRQVLLGAGAAAAGAAVEVILPLNTQHTGAARALVRQEIYCPECLNVFGLLVWPGHEHESGNNVGYVGTRAEMLAGAEVTCACGLRVFVKPWRVAE